MRESNETEDLGTSFRQSRKEFKFMLATWVVFAAWTTGYNALFAHRGEGESVSMILGMPAWVAWGVAFPWGIAILVTIWFAMVYMQDTPLGAEEDSDTAAPQGEEDKP